MSFSQGRTIDQEFKPFSQETLPEIIDFSQTHPPHPSLDAGNVRRYITLLTSSAQNVLDLHTHEVRIAVAVVLDKIDNPGNNATLEILGVDKNVDLRAVYAAFLSEACKLPLHGKSGLEVTLPQSAAWAEKFANENSLEPYYRSVEMINPKLRAEPSERADILTASERDDEDIYEVLCQSFSQNPETSIPPFADWKTSRSTSSRTWLIREHGQLVAFLTLIRPENETPEIRTVGVLADHRGRGLAKSLIQTALQFLQDSGAENCALTVAVNNESALKLYQNLGFQIVDQYQTFRFRFVGH